MPLVPFKEYSPALGEKSFLAPSAWAIGNVETGSRCTILFGAILRGDIEKITLGDCTNVQENAVLHTSHGMPCTVGSYVTIGHNAILHSCTVRDQCIIGMGATVLDGADIGPNCLIGANSLIPTNAVIPQGSLVFGSPARVVRPLKPEELEHLAASARHYVEKGREYLEVFQGL